MTGRLDVAPEDYVVTLAMRGDEGAFSELVRRRQMRVRDMLRRLRVTTPWTHLQFATAGY